PPFRFLRPGDVDGSAETNFGLAPGRPITSQMLISRSTGRRFRRCCFVLGEKNLVDHNHAPLCLPLDLSKLLDYLAIRRITEKITAVIVRPPVSLAVSTLMETLSVPNKATTSRRTAGATYSEQPLVSIILRPCSPISLSMVPGPSPTRKIPDFNS